MHWLLEQVWPIGQLAGARHSTQRLVAVLQNGAGAWQLASLRQPPPQV
jgi:hypothetical protein